MKLRLYRNSLRLRLTPSDVKQLKNAGKISEQTQFSSIFNYSLQIIPNSDFSAVFDSKGITVNLPRDRFDQWADSNEVGVELQQDELQIIIEKDFECLHGEQQANDVFFPNPRKLQV